MNITKIQVLLFKIIPIVRTCFCVAFAGLNIGE